MERLLLFGVRKGSSEPAGVRKGFDVVDTPEGETPSVLAPTESWRTRVFTERDGGARVLLLVLLLAMAGLGV